MNKKIIQNLRTILDKQFTQCEDIACVDEIYRECEIRLVEGEKEHGDIWREKNNLLEAEEESLDKINYLIFDLMKNYSDDILGESDYARAEITLLIQLIRQEAVSYSKIRRLRLLRTINI